jgi:hypothetical protein
MMPPITIAETNPIFKFWQQRSSHNSMQEGHGESHFCSPCPSLSDRATPALLQIWIISSSLGWFVAMLHTWRVRTFNAIQRAAIHARSGKRALAIAVDEGVAVAAITIASSF